MASTFLICMGCFFFTSFTCKTKWNQFHVQFLFKLCWEKNNNNEKQIAFVQHSVGLHAPRCERWWDAHLSAAISHDWLCETKHVTRFEVAKTDGGGWSHGGWDKLKSKGSRLSLVSLLWSVSRDWNNLLIPKVPACAERAGDVSPRR